MLGNKTFDRRSMIRRFGYAGFVAANLIQRRPVRGQVAAPPRRLILFYTPGGFHKEGYSPDGLPSGAVDLPLSQVKLGTTRGGKRQNVLDLLDDPRYSALKNDLLVLDGIDMKALTPGGPNPTAAQMCDAHCDGIEAALRGRPRVLADKVADAGILPGWSIDRAIGANLFRGGNRPVGLRTTNVNILLGDYGYQGSIREACEGGTSLEVKAVDALWDGLFKGFTPPMAGASPSTPAGPPPALVDAYEQRKLLTALHGSELQALKARLGKDEQVTLDRHTAAMDEVTLEIQNLYRAAQSGAAPMGTARGTVPARPDGTAFDPKRQLAQLCAVAANVIVQAMAFDLCRVAVIHLFGQNNNVCYWYPGSTGAYHDGVCHGGTGAGGVMADKALAASKTIIGMYIDIMAKLKAVSEGAGTLLDSTTVASYNDMSDGDHNYRTPALFLIGGGGGLVGGRRYFKSGRYIRYVDRSHNDYLVSLAHAMGVTEIADASGARRPLTQFGAQRYCKAPLEGLTA